MAVHLLCFRKHLTFHHYTKNKFYEKLLFCSFTLHAVAQWGKCISHTGLCISGKHHFHRKGNHRPGLLTRWLLLISGGAGRTVDIWNARTGKLLQSLKGHTDDILTVKCSPNGRLVASGGVDKKVILWDLLTGRQVSVLEGHNDYVRDLDFSPDGKYVCSGSWDRTAIIWDVISGIRLQTLSGHQDNVTSVSFNRTGDKLITGCGDHKLRIWNIEDGALIKTLIGHTDEIWDADWSHNANLIASGAWDNKARVWNPDSGEQVMEFPGHITDVWSVDFDPNGMILATCGGDRTVKLWDLSTGNQIINLSSDTHTSDVEEVVFSPNGKTVTSASRDGTIRFWKVPTLDERIAIMIDNHVAEWSKKRTYEKTAQYEKRMKEIDQQMGRLQSEIIDQVVNYYVENVAWDQGILLGEYNADGEYFKITSPLLGPLRLKVPIEQAPHLAEKFDRIDFKGLRLHYQRGRLVVDSMTAFFKGMNRRYRVTL